MEWVNGTFSTTFLPKSQLYSIVANGSVSASDIIGNWTIVVVHKCCCFDHAVPSRLTTTNIILLALGAVLLCAAIAGVCCVIIFMKIKGMYVDCNPVCEAHSTSRLTISRQSLFTGQLDWTAGLAVKGKFNHILC